MVKKQMPQRYVWREHLSGGPAPSYFIWISDVRWHDGQFLEIHFTSVSILVSLVVMCINPPARVKRFARATAIIMIHESYVITYPIPVAGRYCIFPLGMNTSLGSLNWESNVPLDPHFLLYTPFKSKTWILQLVLSLTKTSDS